MQASPIGTMAGPLRRRIGAALGSPVWRMFFGRICGLLSNLEIQNNKNCLGAWREIKVLPFFVLEVFLYLYMLGYVRVSV